MVTVVVSVPPEVRKQLAETYKRHMVQHDVSMLGIKVTDLYFLLYLKRIEKVFEALFLHGNKSNQYLDCGDEMHMAYDHAASLFDNDELAKTLDTIITIDCGVAKYLDENDRDWALSDHQVAEFLVDSLPSHYTLIGKLRALVDDINEYHFEVDSIDSVTVSETFRVLRLEVV